MKLLGVKQLITMNKGSLISLKFSQKLLKPSYYHLVFLLKKKESYCFWFSFVQNRKILKIRLGILFVVAFLCFHFGIPVGRERENSFFHQPEQYMFETQPCSKETILQLSGMGRAFCLMGQKVRFSYCLQSLLIPKHKPFLHTCLEL